MYLVEFFVQHSKFSSEGGEILEARYCGGEFINGAMGSEVNIAACNFSDLTREICILRNV